MKLTSLVWGLTLLLFAITAPLLSPKEEQNDMEKQQKPRKEQMSEKFAWVDWVVVLKFLEGADVLRRPVKERGGVSLLLPLSFLQSEFQFLSWERRISHRSGKYLLWCQGVLVGLWIWFTFKWLCPNHVASSASFSISWDTGAWVRFCRGELFW